MGFRFRKSINLGKGFRINLSKSGVGYSWGTKGVRLTKTAKGSVRTTLGIPGTGLSYTTESGGKKGRKTEKENQEDLPIGQEPDDQNVDQESQMQEQDNGGDEERTSLWDVVMKVALWILTIFFAVIAAFNIPQTVGFVALAAAALMLPIDKWQAFLSRYFKGWLKIVVAIVLAVVTLIMGPFGAITEWTSNWTDAVQADTQSSADESTGAQGVSEEQDYILNVSSKKFHDPNCASAEDMKESNKQEVHATREDLIEQGYEPCSRCDP